MRNKRIFLGLLLVIALMAFAGCSSNDPDTNMDPNADNSMTDQNGDGMYDDNVDNNDIKDGVNDLENGVEKVVDDAGRAVDDMVTDGAVNNQNNNL